MSTKKDHFLARNVGSQFTYCVSPKFQAFMVIMEFDLPGDRVSHFKLPLDFFLKNMHPTLDPTTKKVLDKSCQMQRGHAKK